VRDGTSARRRGGRERRGGVGKRSGKCELSRRREAKKKTNPFSGGCPLTLASFLCWGPLLEVGRFCPPYIRLSGSANSIFSGWSEKICHHVPDAVGCYRWRILNLCYQRLDDPRLSSMFSEVVIAVCHLQPPLTGGIPHRSRPVPPTPLAL
jgi:hypothetical protein